MRVGECPVRVKRDHVQFARTTICVLVCIPHQLDYYARRLDVLKLCLDTLRANTARDSYDLIVFDNASCAAVIDYLRAWQAAGHIDQLILSARNVGKMHALRAMFDAAPGELVAYTDDDVLFGPQWLESQLQIMETYPRVGMVSARPVRKQFAYGNAYLAEYLTEHQDIRATYGRLIPDEWEREFLHSTGRPDTSTTTPGNDILLECNGVKAFSTANHFQFIAPKGVILAALNKRDQPRTGSEERQFEEAVDAMGYARLSTEGRHVRHIGNVISNDLLDELEGTSSVIDRSIQWLPPGRRWFQFTRIRGVHWALARLNRWTYLLLNYR